MIFWKKLFVFYFVVVVDVSEYSILKREVMLTFPIKINLSIIFVNIVGLK